MQGNGFAAEQGHILPAAGEAFFVTAVPAEAHVRTVGIQLEQEGDVGKLALVFKGNGDADLAGVFHQTVEPGMTEVIDVRCMNAAADVDDHDGNGVSGAGIGAVGQLPQHPFAALPGKPKVVDVPEGGV